MVVNAEYIYTIDRIELFCNFLVIGSHPVDLSQDFVDPKKEIRKRRKKYRFI